MSSSFLVLLALVAPCASAAFPRHTDEMRALCAVSAVAEGRHSVCMGKLSLTQTEYDGNRIKKLIVTPCIRFKDILAP